MQDIAYANFVQKLLVEVPGIQELYQKHFDEPEKGGPKNRNKTP